MAGIKFHGAIDSIISKNHIYRSGNFGIWLDWMTQGTRVTGNLLHDNRNKDLFLEVNHGPFLVDHNLFLSRNWVLTPWMNACCTTANSAFSERRRGLSRLGK